MKLSMNVLLEYYVTIVLIYNVKNFSVVFYYVCFLQRQEVFTKTNEYFENDVKKIRYY